MEVAVLLENRAASKDYIYKHGLSLYIETLHHKILFDTSPDDSFVINARKMGIDLSEVDIAVLSHGHYDHGGGLEAFMKINSKAKIYIGKNAFGNHYHKVFGIFKLRIGINKKLSSDSRFVYVDDFCRIDNELLIFGNVTGNKLVPEGNRKLLADYDNGNIDEDDFKHEINLVIYERDKYNLFCGCAHRGIVNIIEKGKDVIKSEFNTVIGGMHLMDIKIKRENAKSYLNELSDILNNNNVNMYYTGHCTGEHVYGYLNSKMKNLNEIKTGMRFEI